MSLRQVNPEFTQNKEKGCQSQSPSITTCFFLLRTYFQENAIQPRVNQSLGPSHANPCPELIHLFCSDLGPSSHQIHSHVHEKISPRKCMVEDLLMEKSD